MKKINSISVVLFILFIALATVDGWAGPYRTPAYDVWGEFIAGYTCDGASMISCETSIPAPPSQYPYFSHCSCSNGPSCNHYSSRTDCVRVGVNDSKCSAYHLYNCYAYFTNNKCEADSLQCINAGGTWTNTGASTCDGKSCKINHCTAADTAWLSTSIAACTGSNNYAIINTDSTCEHVGICCSNDSTITGDHCTWRCDSLYTECTNRTGRFVSAVLPDTAVFGLDTTFSYKCYYNCSNAYSPDSLTSVTAGNIALTGPGDSVSTGTKVPNDFNSIRTETGGIYIYDFLTPAASDYVDSLTSIKCANHLWRCVKNGKYTYWYDNQDVPDSCTNIVRVK